MSDRRPNNSSGGVPVVPVRRSGHQLIIETCPYCKERHVHGDGGEHSGGSHGHRVAHCRMREDGGAGYILIEPEA
jgi:hypothetical protein